MTPHSSRPQPTARRTYCPDCGRPRPATDECCRDCGSVSPATAQSVIPQRRIPVPVLDLPVPWGPTRWPEGGVATLASPEGMGKSSLAALLGTRTAGLPGIGLWLSTEQDPGEVGELFARLGVPVPPIIALEDPDPHVKVTRAETLLDRMTSRAGTFTVVDSLTEFGAEEAVRVMHAVIRNCRAHGRRGALVNQTTKDGGFAGYNRLKFMPQLVYWLRPDQFGCRLLARTKSRWEGVRFTYFDFVPEGLPNEGRVIQPDFTSIAHSVEGAYPAYELVPYGLAAGSIGGLTAKSRGRTIQWAGLLDGLAQEDALGPFAGYASAAVASVGTASGYLAPRDEMTRRAFAADHGLPWLEIEAAVAVIEQARERRAEEGRERKTEALERKMEARTERLPGRLPVADRAVFATDGAPCAELWDDLNTWDDAPASDFDPEASDPEASDPEVP